MIRALEPAAARAAVEAGAVPLDLRAPTEFAAGHLPGAVNVVFSPRGLGERVATVLPPIDDGPRLLLIGPDGPVPAEAWARIADELISAGLPEPVGYLDGGTAAWQAAGLPVATLPLLSHAALAGTEPQPAILDVREPFEWQRGVIEGAHLLSLGTLPTVLASGQLPDLDPSQPVAVVCGAGVRSSTAASLLQRHGYTRVANLIEGMQGWYNQERPVASSQ